MHSEWKLRECEGMTDFIFRDRPIRLVGHMCSVRLGSSSDSCPHVIAGSVGGRPVRDLKAPWDVVCARAGSKGVRDHNMRLQDSGAGGEPADDRTPARLSLPEKATQLCRSSKGTPHRPQHGGCVAVWQRPAHGAGSHRLHLRPHRTRLDRRSRR